MQAASRAVTRWTADRIWDAVDAWRWIPPSARRVTTDAYDLAVTPGSYALTYVYGFHVDDASQADSRIAELRTHIEGLGGTGARLQVTPRSRPADLSDRLQRAGYRPVEETEVLVWELQAGDGTLRLPEFSVPAGISVREAQTDGDFRRFLELSTEIFGDPKPPDETEREFFSMFHRKLREEGHSDRFLAWDGASPIGRAGLEIAGPVARFWGTGVRSEHRHRGVYGALVWARCESAARRGAEIVLVTARVGTSGPILKRHGFEPMGTTRIFEARW
jgi:Acetyltransferase (GNAT) domain